MPQGRRSLTMGHRWDRTVDVDNDAAPDRRAGGISPGSSRRASDEPQALRELLKPILDELKDKLESFEGEPTPEDHRWLRGQLRKLIDYLDMP
jgi:hypothetical protein